MKIHRLPTTATLLIGFSVVALVLIGLVIVNSRNSKTPSENQTAENIKMISLTDSGFSPTSITVKKGTRVIWTNNTTSTATVFSDDHPSHLKYPQLNLGEFDQGATLQLVLDSAGTFTYHNHLNPSQKGTLIVTE